MAIKKSQIEDKSAYAKAPVDKALKPDEDKQKVSPEKREYNYPEQGVTVRAMSKAEADKQLKNLKN
ncbi:MAG: hypothetical protein V1867_01000 [Candidatus Falkowbacteria bacterium]